MSETLQAKDQSNRPRCEAAHSPLPWKSQRNANEIECVWTTTPAQNIIAKCYRVPHEPHSEYSNAAYIVKACNEYPKLLEALKAARTILAPIVHKMNVRDHFSEKNTLANVIDKAIANAEKSNG